MEKNPLLLVPHDAKAFFIREFGVEAPLWGPRLAPLFHRQLRPFTPLYHQAREEFDAIEPALKAIKKAVQALGRCPRGGLVDAKAATFKTSLEETTQTLSDAVKVFEKAEDELRGLRRAFAKVGNRDKGAILYAKTVAGIFAFYCEPVTFGQDQYGAPSTRYGRVVEYGLAFNGFESHWRRPAEEGFRTSQKRIGTSASARPGSNTKGD